MGATPGRTDVDPATADVIGRLNLAAQYLDAKRRAGVAQVTVNVAAWERLAKDAAAELRRLAGKVAA